MKRALLESWHEAFDAHCRLHRAGFRNLGPTAGYCELIWIFAILSQHVREEPAAGVDEPVTDLKSHQYAETFPLFTRQTGSGNIPLRA